MPVSDKYVKPDNILVVYDGSLHSNNNLRLAASLAQVLNLRLTLMVFPSRQSGASSDDKRLQGFLSWFGLKADTITMRSRRRDSLFEKLEGRANSLLAISAYQSGLSWTAGGWLHSRITSRSIPLLVVP